MPATAPADRSSLRNIGWMTLVVVIALSLPASRLAMHVRRCRIADSLGKLTTEPVGPKWLSNFVERHRLFLGHPVKLLGVLDQGHISNDEALATMARLESLTTLLLVGSDLTDDQLFQLRTLKNLTVLSVRSDKGTPRGLTVLESFPDLRNLDLSHDVWVDDRALVPISHATELEKLSLGGTSITDEGLAQLTSLRKLRTLYLDHTRIHDEGLQALAGLSSLEYLDVSGTSVTDEGISALRSALPKLEITDD